MSYEIITALAAFAFVTSITPGPNNLMVMASSANFGIHRTIPHLLGVSFGFVTLVVLVGAGIAQLFDLYPVSYTILKLFSIAYLLYLAWKIATAVPRQKEDGSGTPLTFLQAALFQWVNPKGWAMALSAISLYAPTQSYGAIALVAIIFGAINLPSVSAWLILGHNMGRMLASPRHARIFNVIMAALLVGSLYPIILS